MFDRYLFSKDPVHADVVGEANRYLRGIREELVDLDYERIISAYSHNQRVLDIGICEHSRERMESPAWKHAILAKHAAKCVGIDIDVELVDIARAKGFDVRFCDATSEINLKEIFDFIHVGDVIEHVENPAHLLRFCSRHLAPGGRILVRTPNPHCYDYVANVWRCGTDVSNLEHISYVVPTHALELARRTGLEFSRYMVMKAPGFSWQGMKRALKNFWQTRSFLHGMAPLFFPSEWFTTIFLFEFFHRTPKEES